MTVVSVCVTVLNEENTILSLLKALKQQTLSPSEIIIADGGSTDNTLKLLHTASSKYQLTVLEDPGNRSVGRNKAIDAASTDWIAITDAGCLPKADWLQKLMEKQKQSGAQVVAGYYDAKATSPLEAAMVPYVLVMPDQVDENHFLPATRSMLLSKSAWEAVGGFDEMLSDNEDYAFARALDQRYDIAFARDAVVTWLPRQTLRQFWWMIFRFARGDIKGEILRGKVKLLAVRYLVALFVCVWLFTYLPFFDALEVIMIFFLGYLCWAVWKNARYVPSGKHWLPILQLAADSAVLSGSAAGIWQRFHT